MSDSESIPDLAGVATKDLVEQKGGGSFSASYINWARTLNLLRKNSPGWMVMACESPDGGILWRSPVGGYLLLCLQHMDGRTTPAVPQAVMDNRNNAVPYDKITARDITDTHRRGACLALAMHFGLAYELWAKDELESGYGGSKAEALAGALRDTAPNSGPAGNGFREEVAKEKGDDVTPSPGDNILPDRPVGNVYEAIERIKKCKTAGGVDRSMADSIYKYKFSLNDRNRMKEAVEYRTSQLKEGD